MGFKHRYFCGQFCFLWGLIQHRRDPEIKILSDNFFARKQYMYFITKNIKSCRPAYLITRARVRAHIYTYTYIRAYKIVFRPNNIVIIFINNFVITFNNNIVINNIVIIHFYK